MATPRQLVRVAVPVPLADAFDYLAGDPIPAIGSRVRVPFGRSERIGIVLDHPVESALPEDKLKTVRESLDADPLIGAELVQTLRWAADYYHFPIGEVLSHALPQPLREGRALEAAAAPLWRLTALGAAAPLDRLRSRARRQAQALEALAAGPQSGAALDLPPAVLNGLAAKGMIEAAPAPGVLPLTHGPAPLAGAPELTADQRAVLATIAAERATERGYRAYLLHGVTGSGKTEIYLQLIAAELAADRQTLLLVPEIGLTPQLVARLGARFGETLAVLHSGLAERERFEAWRRAHRGEARLVVGTRSAVFAPLPRAGLVIVDEEHDSSYKQQRGFRYSARDLAVVRARRLGIPVLLGSATPSLESWHNALQGRYRKLELPRRIGTAGAPQIRIVDLNRHASRHGLSTPLLAALERHLAAGNQVMLFLNRRGYAPALFCPDCKDVELCKRCDARLTVHARAGRLRCHHCGADRPLAWPCPRCGGQRIPVGAGTQRVGDELATLYPRARIARLDRDSTSRKGELAAVLGDVERGDTEILIGTQMLTKGHDFPRVTLVGVLNADQGLFGTDPRSHERLAQTILQVAGRAGRAERPGEVVIQTHYAEHPLLKCLLAQNYAEFAELALVERRESRWPPFSHLAAWRAEAAQRPAAYAFLDKARRIALTSAAARSGRVEVLGPAAQPMERREGRYRAQLLLQSADRGPLHEVLQAVLPQLRTAPEARKVRWSLDVDPLEL